MVMKRGSRYFQEAVEQVFNSILSPLDGIPIPTISSVFPQMREVIAYNFSHH